MRLFYLLLPLIALIPASVRAQEGVLASLDGTITAEETSAATDSLVEAGAAMYFRRDGDVLWVGVESDPIGVSSLCVGTGSEVWVLHASAALGMLTYGAEEDRWRTSDSFAWSLRDTSMSPEALAERQAYLDEHGWVATTSGMGQDGHAEFLLTEDRLPAGDRFVALGIMPSQHPEHILGLPAPSAGDCALGDLVRGMVPGAALSFDPPSWKAMAEPGH